MPFLIRTPETIHLIDGLFDRLYLIKQVMGNDIKNVEGINLNDLIDNFFKKLNDDFAKAGDSPIVNLDEGMWSAFAFLGDLVGTFFVYNGDERDSEYLKLLTEFFNQINQGQEYNMETTWEKIKESELA